MNIHEMLAELRRERERIDDAIAALEKIGSAKQRGGVAASAGKRHKRRLTAEGRKRLSEMMKKRWAERKKRSKAA